MGQEHVISSFPQHCLMWGMNRVTYIWGVSGASTIPTSEGQGRLERRRTFQGRIVHQAMGRDSSRFSKLSLSLQELRALGEAETQAHQRSLESPWGSGGSGSFGDLGPSSSGPLGLWPFIQGSVVNF